MRPSGLHVNKPVIFGLFVTVVVVFLVYRHLTRSTMAKVEVVSSEDKSLKDITELSDDVLSALQRESKEIDIKVEDTTVKIHVEQVFKEIKPKLNVLFLHGAAFSSKDWLEIKSTDYVASWGYRAVAIDLPGKNKSPGKLNDSLVGKFLDAFITTMEMKKVVIIAPSASGNYALPFLFNGTDATNENVVGFVPVAPVGTSHFKARFAASQIQTLIVYGSEDKNISSFLTNLEELPKHKVVKIEGAGHACYMDKPAIFHKALFDFLKELEP